jgi:hypothetical protein
MVRHCRWVLVLVAVSGTSLAAEPEQTDLESFSGQIVDQIAAGVAGIEVQGFAGSNSYRTTTDKSGRFTLRVPRSDGQLFVLADDKARGRLGCCQGGGDTWLRIRLLPARRLPIEVVDADGRPAAGTKVGAVSGFGALPTMTTDREGRVNLWMPQEFTSDAVFAVRSGGEFAFVPGDQLPDPVSEWIRQEPTRLQLTRSRTVRLHAVDAAGQPIAGVELSVGSLSKPGVRKAFMADRVPNLFRARTDDSGTAVIAVADWHHSLTFHLQHEEYLAESMGFDPRTSRDHDVRVKLHRPITATGVVQFPDGRPVEDLWISVVGAAPGHRGFEGAARTDPWGRFEIRLRPELHYLFVASDERWAAPAIDGIFAVPNQPIETLKFRVRPATRIHGRIIGPGAQPMVGQTVKLSQLGRPIEPAPEDRLLIGDQAQAIRPMETRVARTDKNGQFTFHVGPGEFLLEGPAAAGSKSVTVTDQTDIELSLSAERPAPARAVSTSARARRPG